MGTSQRLSKTQRHRYILFYKMYHFSYLLLLTCLGLAAAAPRKHGQDRHHGVQCRTEYTTLWDTEYQDIETHECVTKWVPVCETYTETECSTENREECEYTWEGEGDNVEWVVIPGTCVLQPHDECVDWWVKPYLATILSHWVPLPQPGPPRTQTMGRPEAVRAEQSTGMIESDRRLPCFFSLVKPHVSPH